MRHRRMLAVAGLLVVVSAAVPTRSVALSVRDRDDVGFPLDLARVGIARDDDGDVVIRLKTHDRVADRDVRHGVGWFRVGIDLDGDRGWERNLYIQRDDGRMRGLLVGEDLQTVIGEVSTRRPSRRNFRSTVPAVHLIPGASPRFRAWSVYRAPPCSEREPCTDFVRDRGWIVLDRRLEGRVDPREVRRRG